MSPRAIASVVVFLLLCTWAGWSGGRLVQRHDFVRDASSDRQTRVGLSQAELAGTRPISVIEQAELLGGRVALPRAPLAGMAVGISPVYENARRLTLDSYSRSFDAEPLESGHFLRDWHLDMATVILVALPVLILFGPGLDPFLAIAAGLFGSLVGFFASGPEFGSASAWIRLTLWLLIAGVYGWFWSMVRRWLDRVKGGEAFAIAVYGLIVFVLPGLVTLVARTITPVPSGAAVVAEIRKAGQAPELRDAQELSRFHMTHPSVVDGANPAEYDQRKAASLAAWEKITAGPLDSYQSAITRHRWAANLLSILSPAAAAHAALLETAGNGVGRYASFESQVDEFSRTKWAPFFLGRAQKGQALTAADLGQLPKFNYEEPALMSLLTALLFTLPIAAAAFLVSRR